MTGKGKDRSMLISTIAMAIIAAALLAVGFFRGGSQHVDGLRISRDMIVRILPLLVFAFIVAGMVQVLIPRELLAKWIGRESGLRGILMGTIAGGLAPGGPYVSLPLAAGFLKSGASIGTMVAFITGWSLWAVNRLPMEVGIMGVRFTLIRIACTFFFPPIAGLIAQLIFSGTR